jgi:primosomal protein N' (replication factor Y)
LLTKGAGTEKIEEDIEELFPQAKVARMDLDSTRSKYAYEKIITGFEQHKIDILVGTQMVSKGLDFDNVSVVGVLNADTMLNFPDFRAHERAFQLLTQVSGRAGRKNKRGLVVIQTSDPQHPIVNQVIQYDYLSMFKQQLLERELFKYPPFFRLIYVLVKHKDSLTLNKACLFLSKELKDVLGARVLGPEIPTVGRINNYYIKRFMIKIEIQASSDKAKMLIRNKINLIQQMPEFKSLIVNFDVDPM